MNLTQQRKIEKVMLNRVEKFRKDLLDSTMQEITTRSPKNVELSEKEYESYLKEYKSLKRASDRLNKKVRSFGSPHTQYTGGLGINNMPGLLDKRVFNEALQKDTEEQNVNRTLGRYYRDEGDRVSWVRESCWQAIARDEKDFRSKFPTMAAWYDKDTTLRDFAEEGLIVEVYISDGDSTDLLANLTKQLEKLVQ